jgi:hypothetical protein
MKAAQRGRKTQRHNPHRPVVNRIFPLTIYKGHQIFHLQSV